MTPKQFNAALDKLFASDMANGQTSKGQIELARTLCTDQRTVRRWASGSHPVPTPIAMLLNLMLSTKATKEDLKP